MAGSLDEVIGRLGKESEIIRQLGKERLKEMLTPKTTGLVVVLPPQQIELNNWLAEDSVKGKFVRWWPHKIASAKAWQVEVCPIWDALASILDRLFPGTCNTFNQYEPRPHVTEEQLYPYLKSVHRLSADEVDNLPLVGLLQLLQGDVERSTPVRNPEDARVKRTSQRKLADAAVIAWFRDKPDSDPTAEEIAATVGISKDQSGIVRTTPTWKLHKKGRVASSAGDASHLGDIDKALEEVAGRQERGRNRQAQRKQS